MAPDLIGLSRTLEEHVAETEWPRICFEDHGARETAMSILKPQKYVRHLILIGFLGLAGLLLVGWLVDITGAVGDGDVEGFFELRIPLFGGIRYWLMATLALAGVHGVILARTR